MKFLTLANHFTYSYRSNSVSNHVTDKRIEKLRIFSEKKKKEERKTNLLLLVSSILRNETGNSLVDTALLKEFVEFFLEAGVECVKLFGNRKVNQGARKRR